MSDDIKVALIAAGVSIALWILSLFLEPIKEKITCSLRLKIEHKYNEKKKIKEVISKYKMQLLYAAEELNYRIWNLYMNYSNDWSAWDGDVSSQVSSYYFYSFIYRLSMFFGWANKIECELIFIDMQYADKCDLEFIKYLRLFFKVPCNKRIISDIDHEYSGEYAIDHFFYNELKEFCNRLIRIDLQNDNEFKEFTLRNMNIFSNFINGINPNEDRYRWDMLQLLHYMVMSFLNSFGYDYQYTTSRKFMGILNDHYTRMTLWPSFINNIEEFKMNNEKQLKKLIKYMKKSINRLERKPLIDYFLHNVQ